ncbi:MAG: archease [Candidatus Binatia bacterium]
MPYRFLDDAPPADVGFVASGATLDACFQAAADATLAVMLANPCALQKRQRRALHVEADSVELALLKLLEELIYYKDAECLLLGLTDIHTSRRPGRCVVDATAAGEAVDRARHQLSADVKAVTLHRLKVERTNGGWEATVVLDL